MSERVTRRLAWILVMALMSFVTAWAPGLFFPAYSQTQPELKKFNPQLVGEQGCPVEMVGASTELELDPFGTPIAARHYIDYRNASNRPVVAVKFRIGYVGADGKINQPYVNGDDQQPIEPGAMASKKWRGDKVDPRTTAVKIRVLKVKFADGSVWESVKLNETNSQQQQGFSPLTIESPGSNGDVFSAGQPVPFRDYGQQSYQGLPKNSSGVPLTQTPGQATNGGLYPSGPTPGEFPTRAPAGQYAGGTAGAAGPSVGPGQYATATGAAPPVQTYGTPAGSANADFAPFVPASSAAAPTSGLLPAATSGEAQATSPQNSGLPPAATNAAAAARPSYGAPQGPSYTPPSKVALPAAPADPMAALDAILGTSDKKAPNAVPEKAATSASGLPPAATNAGPPAATNAGSPASTNAGSPAAGNAGSPAAGNAGSPGAATGKPASSVPLRPTMVPGTPMSEPSAPDSAAGSGDKSLDLR